ncbi:arylsulfotransferase family protein [Saccharopolyspora sp. TS4A08]|uniref:Arylsulfotransferase family protein n=1 Tax=Saccharopolyspora ipomoeae TaxID=3042027 RepID=A0ABT6PGG0_9PSEU|nr:arylsulfotransferase family protein [Saccharopolyspora sp. TS4A08]MDI2027009.1 arylsulfotransferase family protein [Saccharopolyspora sp. TS4A08]
MSTTELGRRSVLRMLAAAPLVPAALSGAAQAAPRPSVGALGADLVTRPDLHPPLMEIITPAAGTEPGQVLLTPTGASTMDVNAPAPRAPIQPGAMLMDDTGQPVWFGPSSEGVNFDLKVQQYQGKPVLTFWEGKVVVPPGFGHGKFVIMDEAYARIAEVVPANDLTGDLHEFVITPQGTALILAYREVRLDTTPVGGQPNSKVLEGVVQEIDIASGELIFEWNSLEHVGLDESFYPVPKDPEAFHDYIHLNAICEDGDALLISARCTHAIYRIDRASGEVKWRLCGRKSDFAMSEDAGFAWQHDVRRHSDGTISLFDNADAAGRAKSRGMTLNVDEAARTATLLRSAESPEGLLAPNQGNAQLLANGHMFVGWGGQPYFTEFGPNNEVLFHGRFTETMASYRAHRAQWVGKPADSPAVVGKPGDGITSVYTSWNGATEVTTWRALAGPDDQNLTAVADAEKTGFETKIDIQGAHPVVAVEALDASGNVLGRSPAVAVA